jgi:hypothetical protein
MTPAPEGPISLVGEELNTVAFVMDYVEFHFNGPRLRALTDPRVQIGLRTWVFPGPGSRDALCALIGRTVQAVSLHLDEHLVLRFPEAILTVPLDEGSRHGPEAAHFHAPRDDGADSMWIW